jgi:DNA-binding CsgD family transcriptional regulator
VATTLAGLLSDDAAVLYGRLVRGTDNRPVDAENAAVRELLDAGLLRLRPDGGRDVLPPPAALQLMLARRQGEIQAAYQQINEGWRLLEALITDARHEGDPIEAGNDIVVITDDSIVQQTVAELYRSTRRELRATMTAYVRRIEDADYALTPTETAKGSGAQFRHLYDASFTRDPVGAQVIKRSLEAGEEARICAELPTRFFLVDGSVALIALTPTGLDGAALVRSAPLLTLLGDWFEAVWNAPETTEIVAAPRDPLTPDQHAVLRLLADGRTDDAIARSLGSSVKTVRRNVGAILAALGVSSRLAAGAAAVKRGWI